VVRFRELKHVATTATDHRHVPGRSPAPVLVSVFGSDTAEIVEVGDGGKTVLLDDVSESVDNEISFISGLELDL
jgi:hypothetical protein